MRDLHIAHVRDPRFPHAWRPISRRLVNHASDPVGRGGLRHDASNRCQAREPGAYTLEATITAPPGTIGRAVRACAHPDRASSALRAWSPSRCLDDLEALVLQRINGASTDRQFVFDDNDHTTIEEPFTLFPGLPSPE